MQLKLTRKWLSVLVRPHFRGGRGDDNWKKMKGGHPLDKIEPLRARCRMTFLPSVIRARHRGGYRIHVTFNDSTEKTIDFLPWLEGPVFEPLKDPDYFGRFFLDGGTVAWPNGADIAPETLSDYREPASKPSAPHV